MPLRPTRVAEMQSSSKQQSACRGGAAVRWGWVLLHCYGCTGLADLPHQGVLQHALVLLQEQDGPQHGQALLQRLHPEEDQGARVGGHLHNRPYLCTLVLSGWAVSRVKLRAWKDWQARL